MPLFFRLSVKSSPLRRKKTFMKSNRQYLKNQQTVLSAPDSPCQTVLKFPDSFEFFGFLFTPVKENLLPFYFLDRSTSKSCTCSPGQNFFFFPRLEAPPERQGRIPLTLQKIIAAKAAEHHYIP